MTNSHFVFEKLYPEHHKKKILYYLSPNFYNSDLLTMN